MAKAFLHSVSLDDDRIDRWMQGAYALLKESARLDTHGVHTLTTDAEAADVIVFLELGAHGIFSERVRHHELVRRFREKCFLFDPGDYSLPFLPGLYASLRKRYNDPSRTLTGYYLRIDENPFVDFRPPVETYQYIASFVGSIQNHPVRRELARLPRDRFLIADTSSFAPEMLRGGGEEERRRFWSDYAEAIASVPFALCPRGRGPGSVRLFEVMRMGRVPVIMSDEWVLPHRVDWNSFAIIISEKEVHQLPEILHQYEPKAAEMGLRAREEWEKYYSPSVRFHWLIEDCLALKRARRVPEFFAQRLIWKYLCNVETFRRYVSSKKAIYRDTQEILL